MPETRDQPFQQAPAWQVQDDATRPRWCRVSYGLLAEAKHLKTVEQKWRLAWVAASLAARNSAPAGLPSKAPPTTYANDSMYSNTFPDKATTTGCINSCQCGSQEKWMHDQCRAMLVCSTCIQDATASKLLNIGQLALKIKIMLLQHPHAVKVGGRLQLYTL